MERIYSEGTWLVVEIEIPNKSDFIRLNVFNRLSLPINLLTTFLINLILF